jgi:cytochrome c-type biogenesis protein CcmH
MRMGFALALLAMTTLAVAVLLVPLILRRRAAASRDAYNLAVYRDQLTEIERDVGRGVLDAGDAEAAKAEIGRRILMLTPATAEAPTARAPLAVATTAILLLPIAAWTIYWQIGSPGLDDVPHAARATAPAPHVDVASALEQLTAHLETHPDDLKGWILLARTDLDQRHYADAAEAYRHAADLSGHKPEIMGDWGEAQLLAAGGTVTPQAREAFQAALADPESAPRSRYYLALADMQGGDAKKALQEWVDLEADSPDGAAWLPLLRDRIANTAKTVGVDPATLKTSSGAPRKIAASPSTPAPAGMPPTATVEETEKATANATPEERQAMIEGMVAKLAARLEKEPEDVAGWVQLGRSYMVLNQPQKAQEAFARAARLKPGYIPIKEQYAEAIIAAAGDGQLPEAATALWREVLGAEPQNPDALWYVGLAEAAAGRPDTARELWTRLLAQLTEGSEDYREVSQRLAELKPPAPK